MGADGQLDLSKAPGPHDSPDPWQVLGIPCRLDLDLSAVELQVRGLIRNLHPDRFYCDGPQAVADAQRHTALVNDAWRILRDRERRIAWLLDHLGQAATRLPSALAHLAFERNELVDDALADPLGFAGQIAQLRADVRTERTQLTTDVLAATRQWDAAQDAADPVSAAIAAQTLGLLMAQAPSLDNLLVRLH